MDADADRRLSRMKVVEFCEFLLQCLIAFLLILVELLGDAFIPREELHLPTELGIHLLLVRASFFRWLAELLADRRVKAGETVIEDFLAFGADDRLDLFADLGCLLFPNRKLSLVTGDFRVRPKRDVIVSLGMSEKTPAGGSSRPAGWGRTCDRGTWRSRR